MNIRELVNTGAKELEKNSDTPRLDASILLSHTLKMPRAKLLAYYCENIDKEDESSYKELIIKRTKGYPISYILGEKEFYGYNFHIEEGVLTPRPDTEVLVEETISRIKSDGSKTVLDLCTGTGCIGITIKLECPEVDVTCVDISPISEKVFNINNKNLAGGKVNFLHSDLFSNIKDNTYDIIVTNPPYLTTLETDDRMDSGWKEPSLALDGGNDGLDLVRKIIIQSKKYLNPRGWLLIEADPAQMAEIKRVLTEQLFSDISIYKDMPGFDRIIVGHYE